MKSARWIVLVLLLLPLAALSQNIDEKLLDWAFPTRHERGAAQYQHSESVSVTLGIWDKGGAARGAVPEFVVTCPSGKECRVTARKAKLPDWLEVRFPEDFTGCHDVPGEYTWICVIGGKTVLRGRFQLCDDLQPGTLESRAGEVTRPFLKQLRVSIFALASAAGLWILSPAACGPHGWQVKRDWDVFVANRDECLRTVRMGRMTVATKRVHAEYAEVEIDVGGQWIPGRSDPGWFSNTPCAGFHSGTEWLQGVHRTLVYRRHGIGWEIDLWQSFALQPQQTISWDWKKRASDYVEESPENLER